MKRCILGCVLSCAWASAGVCAEARPAATQAATRPATEAASSRPAPAEAVKGEVLRRFGVIAPLLAAREAAAARKARAAVINVQRALLDAVLARAEDRDPEVAARVREVLREITRDVRLRRVLLKLPEAEGRKLLAFQKRHGDVFAAGFSADMDRRLAAVRRIDELTDPGGLAGPLLALFILGPSPELAEAAARAAAREDYHCDLIVDSLCRMVYRHWMGADGGSSRHLRAPRPAEAGLEALAALRAPRAGPMLLSLSVHGRRQDVELHVLLAKALGSTGELRLIPPLMAELQRTEAQHSRGMQEVRVGTARSDYALLALLLLTRQSPGTYGLVHLADERTNWVLFGFPDAKERSAAIAKFRQWWHESRGSSPYRGLKGLSVPDSPLEAIGPGRPDRPLPPQAPPGIAAAAAERIDTADLADALAAHVSEIVERFRLARLSRRREAQTELLELHGSLVDGLAAASAGDDRAAEAIVGVLGDMVAEARAAEAMAGLSPRERRELRGLRQAEPQLCADVFAPNWDRNLGALKKIAGLADPQARRAEALMAVLLRHPSPQMVCEAARIAARIEYRSRAVTAALCDIMASVTADRWDTYHHGGLPVPHMEALKAVSAIRCKEAAPVLLALLRRQTGVNQLSRQCFAEALAATGEVGAVPALIEVLKSAGSTYGTWSMNKVRITLSPADAPLLALVKLTGQRTEDYGLTQLPFKYGSYGINPIGFASEEQRKAAVRKFMQWWQQNKDKPPYKDLAALPIPALPG